jgi:hypothetical protein
LACFFDGGSIPDHHDTARNNAGSVAGGIQFVYFSVRGD